MPLPLTWPPATVRPTEHVDPPRACRGHPLPQTCSDGAAGKRMTAQMSAGHPIRVIGPNRRLSAGGRRRAEDVGHVVEATIRGRPNLPCNHRGNAPSEIAGDLRPFPQRRARLSSLDPEGGVIRGVRKGAQHIGDGREPPVALSVDPSRGARSAIGTSVTVISSTCPLCLSRPRPPEARRLRTHSLSPR